MKALVCPEEMKQEAGSLLEETRICVKLFKTPLSAHFTVLSTEIKQGERRRLDMLCGIPCFLFSGQLDVYNII